MADEIEIRYRVHPIRGAIDKENGNAWIEPSTPAWDAYQAWIAAGNVPEPPELPPGVSPEQAEIDADKAEAREWRTALLQDPLITGLRKRTPDQISTWIDNNVNNLADAKGVLKSMARLLVVLARREFRRTEGGQ